MIKVLQERRVKKEDYARLIAHLTDLRAAALHQPGYLTGETIAKGNDNRCASHLYLGFRRLLESMGNLGTAHRIE